MESPPATQIVPFQATECHEAVEGTVAAAVQVRPSVEVAITPPRVFSPTATQILPFHPTDWQLVVKSAFPDVLPIQFADPSAL
jgi:hypothetical protein